MTYTYTLQSRSVQRTAHWTQTHEGSHAVLTISINTGARETLVDICYKTTRLFFSTWYRWSNILKCFKMQQNKWVSDLRRHLYLDQRGILLDNDKWNCLVYSCIGHFHTDVCSSDIHHYLKKNTDRDDLLDTGFWNHSINTRVRARMNAA